MEIRPLDRETYTGRKFTARYMTSGYYEIGPCTDGFTMRYTRFDAPVEHTYNVEMFRDWLSDPVAYGAFEDGQLIGFIEGFHEKWNNRYRISNIFVFEETSRRSGVGTALMQTMLQTARDAGARMAVLETQSCNEKAIAFYRKQGFEIIGFDMYCYTNADPDRHEVRVELGKKLV